MSINSVHVTRKGKRHDSWKAQITNGLDGRGDDADGDNFTNLLTGERIMKDELWRKPLSQAFRINGGGPSGLTTGVSYNPTGDSAPASAAPEPIPDTTPPQLNFLDPVNGCRRNLRPGSHPKRNDQLGEDQRQTAVLSVLRDHPAPRGS